LNTRFASGEAEHDESYMRMFRVLKAASVAVVAALLCLGALPAAAQDDGSDGPTPRLFLLPTQSVRDSVTSIVPERIGELLREQVGKDDRVELMPDYAELRKQLGGSTAAIAKAESLYTSGIGTLTAGDDKKAAETFQRAVDMMEQNLADLGNYDVLTDALANLALAYWNAEFDLDARKRMKQFAHLRPDATLDPEKYPKELMQIFQREAKKVKSAGAGKLEITASVGDALVYIDGVEKGKAPLTVEDVGFGYHYLVVRSPTGSVWAEKIRVRGRGKAQKFEADLGKAPETPQADAGGAEGELPPFYTDLLETIETGQFGTDLGPYLKELASQTGAAHIAWVVMFKEGTDYVAAPFAYRASDGLIVRADDVRFNIELSNLLVGVSTLSSSVVEIALKMPEDKAVTEVQLGEPPPTEVAEAETNDSETSTGTTDVQTESAYETGDPIQPPPKVPPSQATNTWTYVGIAAGGLAVVGLVAGGIFLLSEDGNPSAAPGFNTEVSW
jgi:hypothetical protein